jgi:16S rRNA (adenine1518-N6/adenine1519-N6)-dimethyltransferase
MKAKKSLGQNFLKSGSILNQIVKAGQLSEEDFVLEIGPGKGALTEKILGAGATVLAIEKDHRLIEFLNDKFSKYISEEKLKIVEGDVLEFDPSEISSALFFENSPNDLSNKKYKLIANIPYYLTGEIIEKFLSTDNQPESAVLLVQKEVADRILARDGKESILSNAVKIYCQPKNITKVPARFFSPAPKVDSAVIALENISKEKFATAGITEGDFFKIMKTGFAHKRKVLISNLAGLEIQNKKIDRVQLEKVFEELEIDLKIRAEKLTTSGWIKLTQELQ